jgi:putative protein-disulfide isomerase
MTHLFDPLCGWCYGAGPVLEKLAALGGVTLEFAPTGLFAGMNARPMDASFAAYAWQNDQRIAQLTGQAFSDAYRSTLFGAAGAMFDSAPATLGITAVGLTEPSRQLEALKALQRARYIEGRDNSDLGEVSEILAHAGFAEAARRVRSPDEELLGTYRRRIEAARADMTRFGADGVPALVVGEGSGRRLMRSDALFGGFDALASHIQAAA